MQGPVWGTSRALKSADYAQLLRFRNLPRLLTGDRSRRYVHPVSRDILTIGSERQCCRGIGQSRPKNIARPAQGGRGLMPPCPVARSGELPARCVQPDFERRGSRNRLSRRRTQLRRQWEWRSAKTDDLENSVSRRLNSLQLRQARQRSHSFFIGHNRQILECRWTASEHKTPFSSSKRTALLLRANDSRGS